MSIPAGAAKASGAEGVASLHVGMVTHPQVGLGLARVELLVAEDELREALRSTLNGCGWSCGDIGEPDLERVQHENWNLIVIGSSIANERNVAASARAARNPRTRVLVVTPTRDPQQIADILRAGADDHVTIPYEPDEVCARARALIAFSFSLPARRRFGTIGFDFAARTVFDRQARVSFSPGEWDVLIALLDADGEPVAATVLTGGLGSDAGQAVSVASLVSRIRRKLRLNGIHALEIETHAGRGYTLLYRRHDA